MLDSSFVKRYGGLVAALSRRRVVQCLQNRNYDPASAIVAAHHELPANLQREARDEMRSWPNFVRSPLVEVPGLAQAAGVLRAWIKDESPRLGLGSFKGLGGSYAVSRLAGRGRSHSADRDGSALPTVACATAGNHGRAVAWGARRTGCACVIYLHSAVSDFRESALIALGARTVRVAGNYDDSVRAVTAEAHQNGWILVGDTSDDEQDWAPQLVMMGYTVLADELTTQFSTVDRPTHVFVQTGVGGLAAALIAVLYERWENLPPRIVTVEPERAACVLSSLEAHRRVAISGDRDSIMAGLACGEVSYRAWPIIKAGVSDALAISDELVPAAMRLMYLGTAGDPSIISGETGVAGVVALLATTYDPIVRAALGLNSSSRVLLLNTEGDTDPEIYASLVPEAAGRLGDRASLLRN
jgi:diaminopropionate ammonia-lyase